MTGRTAKAHGSAIAARNAWLAELSTGGASPHTLTGYRAVTDEALATIAERHGVACTELKLDAIDRDDIIAAMAAYQDRPDGRSGQAVKRATSTVGRFFTAVRSFFSWCQLTDKLEQNPASRIKRPKSPTRVPKAMSAQECRALLDEARRSRAAERDVLAVLLGITGGLRLAEMVRLNLDSFVETDGTITHMRIIGKGDKERVIPVAEVIRQALEEYLPVRAARLQRDGVLCDALFVSQRGGAGGSVAMTPDGLGQVFDRLLTQAGLKVPGRRVHVTRHSFATHVLHAGADILSVSELLGHANVSTTQVYLKVDPSRLSAAVEANPLAHID